MQFSNITIKEILTISFTLFAVIDIIGSIPILATLRAKMGGEIRSLQATIVSGALMIGFLLVGEQFLGFLGLDAHSFVVPIAFPLIAGSGTLTTVMSLRANFHVINIFIGILINLIVIYLVLRSLKWIERVLGPNGMTVIRKFFGVILLAIAVKIFSTNVQSLGIPN